MSMKHLIVMLGVMGVSLSPIFVRFSSAPSMVLVFYRVTYATLLLTPYILWRHWGEVKALKKRDWMLCILAGIFLGLHFVSYFESLRRTAIAPAAVLVNTEAIFVTIGTVLFMIVMSIMEHFKVGGESLWLGTVDSGGIADFQMVFNILTAVVLLRP